MSLSAFQTDGVSVQWRESNRRPFWLKHEQPCGFSQGSWKGSGRSQWGRGYVKQADVCVATPPGWATPPESPCRTIFTGSAQYLTRRCLEVSKQRRGSTRPDLDTTPKRTSSSEPFPVKQANAMNGCFWRPVLILVFVSSYHFSY